MLDEVSVLFADHADLLKEFTYFLPDAVQGQAKAQLDVAAAKAEERAKQRAAQAKAAGKGPSSMIGSPPGVVANQSNFVPSPAGGMILPPPPAATVDSAHKLMPSVPSNVPRSPFGATKSRSEDRENESAATEKYSRVSFDPVSPPRR